VDQVRVGAESTFTLDAAIAESEGYPLISHCGHGGNYNRRGARVPPV